MLVSWAITEKETNKKWKRTCAMSVSSAPKQIRVISNQERGTNSGMS